MARNTKLSLLGMLHRSLVHRRARSLSALVAMTVLFLVSSSFTLAKVIRDQQEAATIRVRIDEARLEKLIAEHDPFATTT